MIVLASLAGFLVVSGLLFTNHPGFAIKLTNYLYSLILLGVALGVFHNEAKK